MATRLLQAVYYSRRYGSNSPKLPHKGSARYQRDFNWILTIIVGLYLLSLVYDSVRTMKENHYDTLGLKFGTFTQKQLKTNFRKASLQYHPDKAGQAGADMFVGIRAAHEILVDPTLRLNYDRFGSTVLKCTACKTNKDYLQEGLKAFYTFYAAAGIVFFLVNLVGKGNYGRYWRFIMLVGMGAIEMSLVLTAGNVGGGGWMERLMPGLVPFEQIAVLHQLYISASVAVSQVGPLLFPEGKEKQEPSSELIKRLQTLTEIAAAETAVQVKSWMDTLVGQDECITQLRRELGYMSLEMKLGDDSAFFNTRTAIKARIERQSKIHQKERLAHID
ncbi:hypothetical protein EC957_004708 [Mortierella hygrophila]|uniref:J domain-containing protein n=1 Tax=Mortierella hygrophila TaxID=979708 RepID=A0A9P6F184_9FUNG|nr:hypothetical protein EC957_004708 [Mortierella hygrophila]